MPSKFRTTEISDPQFEQNGLRFITVKTPHLKGRGDICLFVPEIETSISDLPLVILMHGVYGSAWCWAMKGGAHLTAQRLISEGKIKPMVVAMPSDGLWGDGSGYLTHHSRNFEKWISEDVPAAVKENIPLVTGKSLLFISGLSMGGFGALRIGAKYPEKFRAISGHSSITALEQMKLFVEEPLSDYKQDNAIDEDVFKTMQSNQNQLPPIRFDCGKNDLLIEHNRLLHQQLEKANIPHKYEEFGGEHSWDYWQKHLEDTLEFFNAQLR
ncbi:alpha/beta hydrolase [Flexithrix dorotheae]|uniref:alpha/beta hydrolase n=1 Tax=Flexithrix dorotheae TaxID=70993 RepID=UPI000366B120|nr:alpha/beta hydrolase-fold protein [Flexithrix dorotheae]